MMNPEADLDLMRQVLMVRTEPSQHARRDARLALIDAIHAESRVRRASRHRGRFRPRGARRIALLGAALLIGATGATAATVITIDSFGHDTPTQLFRDNPDRFGSPWVKQSLVPGTVRLVEAINVPGVGGAEYWTAAATHHGLCVGLRLPGRVWAGSANKFQIGGPVPGCVYEFSADPQRGWSPKNGFFWFEYQEGGNWHGRIVIGTVPSVGSPVAVRDAFTDTTTRLVDGRYFAILIPPSRGQWESWTQGNLRVLQLRYRLETLGASGRVLAQAPQTIEP